MKVRKYLVVDTLNESSVIFTRQQIAVEYDLQTEQFEQVCEMEVGDVLTFEGHVYDNEALKITRLSDEEWTIYNRKGYHSREDYLHFLADEYGMPVENVFSLAEVLGENEDFSGLVNELSDWADQQMEG